MTYRTTIHTSSFKIPKGGNNTDNKFDEQFLVIQDTVEDNKQEADEKLTHITENLKVLTAFMMDHTKNSKLSPAQKDKSTPPYPNTVVSSNRRYTQMDGVNSTKISGI